MKEIKLTGVQFNQLNAICKYQIKEYDWMAKTSTDPLDKRIAKESSNSITLLLAHINK